MNKQNIKEIIFNYKNNLIKINAYDDLIFRNIRKKQSFYELNLLEKISSLISDKDGVIIDGGSNIGNHAIFFSMFCGKTTVYAYEPFIKISNILKKNIINNNINNIIVNNNVLFNKKSFFNLKLLNEQNYGATEFEETNKETDFKSEIIDEKFLDQKVKCIKLDVQHMEYPALLGAERVIEKFRPLIVAEATHEQEFKLLNNFLVKYGYLIVKNNERLSYNSTPTYIWKVE